MTQPINASGTWTDQQVSETLSRARAKMKSLRNRLGEPLAIIGIGCRFPGATGPDAFWNSLREGQCSIRETPEDRWDRSLRAGSEKEPGKITANQGGYLDQVDRFDAPFFGIARREAESLDPQQRILLETAWETLEHASLDPHRLRGSRTGVFVGICSNDYSQLLAARDRDCIDAYVGTGNSHSTAAGRLSYFLNWRGPSVAIDTACSSSLSAVHMAVRSLRYGDCDLALVAGVNMILAPELSINLSQAGMLSPTGCCHTFDDSADGFVRGEGCGAILVKRLSKAIEDGDSIICTILGSGSNQDGRSNGLTAPNGVSQQAVIRSALKDAHVDPDQVDYVEAHGTGTPLGDPIEIGALVSVFAEHRKRSTPLRVGSVKTNIGHLEGAAGIAGLIKVALSLENECIPPHLHFEKPSQHIDWSHPIKVNAEASDWKRAGRPRIAGVSSFGFGGSNAHIVLGEAPVAPEEMRVASSRDGSKTHMLTLSAKSATALKQYASRLSESLTGQSISAICQTLNRGRADLDFRLAILGDHTDEFVTRLASYAKHSKDVDTWTGSSSDDYSMLWMFGDACDSSRFGATLYGQHNEFRATIDQCEELLAPCWPRKLTAFLWDSKSELNRQEQLLATFALQYATARFWQSWGVAPHTVLGHGTGECPAACIAGVISLSDAIKLIGSYASAMELSSAAQADHIRRCLSDMSLTLPNCGYLSTMPGYASRTQEEMARGLTTTEFWIEHFLASRGEHAHRVDQPSTALVRLLEVGSNTQLGDRVFGGKDASQTVKYPGFDPARCEWRQALTCLARMYVDGAAVNLENAEPTTTPRLRLPTYPFESKRYWADLDDEKGHEAIGARGTSVHPLLGSRIDLAGKTTVFETDLREMSYLADHQVGSTPVFPLAGFLELALAAGREVSQSPVVVQDLEVLRPLTWEAGKTCRIQVVLEGEDSDFECGIFRHEMEQWKEYGRCRLVLRHSSGALLDERRTVADSPDSPQHDAVAAIQVDSDLFDREISSVEHYERCNQVGLVYGPGFQGVKRLWGGALQARGEVAVPDTINVAGYLMHPSLLDACFQVTAAALEDDSDRAWLPANVGQYHLAEDTEQLERLDVFAFVESDPAGDKLLVNLDIRNQNSQLVSRIDNLLLKPIKAKTLSHTEANSRSGGSVDGVALELMQATPDQRLILLRQFLHTRLAAIMSLTLEEIPLDRPLDGLGLDSLMALELRDELERNLGMLVPMEVFLQDLTLNDFTEFLERKLNEKTNTQADDGNSESDSMISPIKESWIEGAI